MSISARSLLWKGLTPLRKVFSVRPPCSVRRLYLSGAVLQQSVRNTSSARPLWHAFQPKKQHLEDETNPSLTDANESPPPTSGVLFREYEREYYHSVMENSELYRDTIFTRNYLETLLKLDSADITPFLERECWKEATTNEIVEAFRSITSYAHSNNLEVSDPGFNHICSAISARLEDFTDDEMMEIGKLHTLWKFPGSFRDPNYKLLNKSFDKFCCKRYSEDWYPSRNIERILQAADIFYWQRTGNSNHYLRMMVYHCGIKVTEHHHLIQILFYLGLMQSAPATYKFYDLEKKLYSFREKVSLRELLIVANSMFRLKSRLQYLPLVEDLLLKTVKGFDSVDDYQLTTLSKGSTEIPSELLPILSVIRKKTMTRREDFKLVTIVHALWLFASTGVLDDDFLQYVFNRASNNMSDMRTKELTRLMVVFTEYLSPNRDLKKFGESVLEEIKTREKREWLFKKPFIMGAFLHRLLLCGVYPNYFYDLYFKAVEDHVESTRRPEFNLVPTVYEALGIDVHLEVFYPDYTGTRLRPDLREAMFQYKFGGDGGTFVKSSGAQGKRSSFNLRYVNMMKDVVLEMLEGKEDHRLVKQLAPSFGYLDLVLRVSKDGKFLPIPEEMRKSLPWELTRVPSQCIEDGDKFLALTFTFDSTIYSKLKISCLQREKVKILEKMGFIHKEVGVQDWQGATLSQKMMELQSIVSEAVFS